MSETTYHNAPPRGCQTCLFCEKGTLGSDFWACGKQGGLGCAIIRRAVIERGVDTGCDQNFSGWRPIPPEPPRRSLRQWLYDTFWA